jgi:UDP-N-acetylglucosamine 2-epimerase (non-hydrolysing)
MKLIQVVSARPNFMKAAPVWKAINKITYFTQILVHTGQHYNKLMSDTFFEELLRNLLSFARIYSNH